MARAAATTQESRFSPTPAVYGATRQHDTGAPAGRAASSLVKTTRQQETTGSTIDQTVTPSAKPLEPPTEDSILGESEGPKSLAEERDRNGGEVREVAQGQAQQAHRPIHGGLLRENCGDLDLERGDPGDDEPRERRMIEALRNADPNIIHGREQQRRNMAQQGVNAERNGGNDQDEPGDGESKVLLAAIGLGLVVSLRVIYDTNFS